MNSSKVLFPLNQDTGTVEGLNNKAKVISHKAYGFRAADLLSATSTTAWPIYQLLLSCADLCEEPLFGFD